MGFDIGNLRFAGSILLLYFPDPEKSNDLVYLVGAHSARYCMIFCIDANQCCGVIIIDLYFGEVRNAVLPFGKDAVTTRAVQLIKYFSFFGFLYQQLLVQFSNMVRDIVFYFLLIAALEE